MMSGIKDGWIVVGLLLSAALYHPLQVLIANPWEIASPPKALMFAGLTLAVEGLAYFAFSRSTDRPLWSALLVAMATMTAMSWNRAPLALAFLFAGFAILLGRASPAIQRGSALAIVVFFGLGAVGQLIFAHATNLTSYPLAVAPVGNGPATATGLAEDVLLVVVDQYPALNLAEAWYGHDPTPLTDQLTDLGFTTPSAAWTTNSMTLLAVPSILSLEQVGEEYPQTYGNKRSVHSVVGGENLTSNTLRKAGFTYHHVESGWEAGNCRAEGTCLDGPFLDELTFTLYRDSVLGSWMHETTGGVFRHGALHTRDTLSSLRSEFGDGNHDFVFAHFLLPHDPFVVDGTCRLSPGIELTAKVAAQLRCSDRLIAEAASLATDTTAVLITGDHGTNGYQQRTKHGDVWTDEEILERFGVFMSYHLPEGCAQPQAMITTEVMRGVVSCAVATELPPSDVRFLIGIDDAVWIDGDRMARIMATDP